MANNNLLPFLKDGQVPLASPEDQLRYKMIDCGIPAPNSILLDGNIHRFSTSEKGGDDAGWYIGYSDGVPAGKFGDFRAGIEQNWTANIGRSLTPIEIMQNSMRMSEAKRRHEEEKRLKNERAAETCELVWEQSNGAGNQHPYLVKKGIQPHTLRISKDGKLIAPMHDVHGSLCSLQTIDHEGGKLFFTGGKVSGAMCVLGEIKDKFYICEGYATGATIYEQTGIATVIAYSANNIPTVAGLLRDKYHTARITIVADRDNHGVGMNYATQANAKYGCTIIQSPQIEKCTDVNDAWLAGYDIKTLLLPQNNDLKKKLHVIMGDELPTEFEAPDEIIEGMFTSNSISLLYGDSNSGKTFFALSLAVAVATGSECYGRKTEKGKVLYLATEAPGSIRSRLQAVKKLHGTDLSNIAIVQVPLNFYSNAGDAADVLALIEELGDVKLIIADTLARMSAGANENSGEDMGPVMERFDLLHQKTKAALLIIHHSGKDTAKGARGWSGIRAHVDTEIEVFEKEHERTAVITKQRELGSKGDVIQFKLEIVEMGVSKFGSMVSTCVAVSDFRVETKNENKKSETVKKTIDKAWYFSGCEVLDDRPYISTSALENYFVDNAGMQPSTAKRHAKPAGNGTATDAIENGIIEKKLHGYIVINEPLSAKLLLSIKEIKGTKGTIEGTKGT